MRGSEHRRRLAGARPLLWGLLLALAIHFFRRRGPAHQTHDHAGAASGDSAPPQRGAGNPTALGKVATPPRRSRRLAVVGLIILTCLVVAGASTRLLPHNNPLVWITLGAILAGLIAAAVLVFSKSHAWPDVLAGASVGLGGLLVAWLITTSSDPSGQLMFSMRHLSDLEYSAGGRVRLEVDAGWFSCDYKMTVVMDAMRDIEGYSSTGPSWAMSVLSRDLSSTSSPTTDGVIISDISSELVPESGVAVATGPTAEHVASNTNPVDVSTSLSISGSLPWRSLGSCWVPVPRVGAPGPMIAFKQAYRSGGNRPRTMIPTGTPITVSGADLRPVSGEASINTAQYGCDVVPASGGGGMVMDTCDRFIVVEEPAAAVMRAILAISAGALLSLAAQILWEVRRGRVQRNS